MTEHLELDMEDIIPIPTTLTEEEIPSPTELIEDSMELYFGGVDDRPSAWYAIRDLLDAFNEVNGNWTKEERNVVKRFLKGFVDKTMVVEHLPRNQKITINWLLSNGGEDIGNPSKEETELVEKWANKFKSKSTLKHTTSNS